MTQSTKWLVTFALMALTITSWFVAVAYAGVALITYMVLSCYVIVLCPTKCKKAEAEHGKAK